MEAASELEYLQWFYHTMRQGKTEYFAFKMKQKFESERGKRCPFIFPGLDEVVDARKV